MARFRMNDNMNMDPRMQRQALQNKLNAARMNLLAVVAFTLVNILALATNAGSYFLFSASVPYIITMMAMMLCGLLPPEAYEGMEGMFFLDKSLFYVAIVISLLIVALYVVCFFLSKKKSVWLTVALVLFAIDTLVMFLFYGISFDMLFDIAFHGWVMWILYSGVKAEKDLKKMPKPDAVIETDYTELPVDESMRENTEYRVQIPEVEAHVEEKSAEENVADEPVVDEKSAENNGFSAAKGPLDI